MLNCIQLKFVTNIKIEIYKIVQNVSNLSDKLEIREMSLKRQNPQLEVQKIRIELNIFFII
jgi:hypothetical protein